MQNHQVRKRAVAVMEVAARASEDAVALPLPANDDHVQAKAGWKHTLLVGILIAAGFATVLWVAFLGTVLANLAWSLI